MTSKSGQPIERHAPKRRRTRAGSGRASRGLAALNLKGWALVFLSAMTAATGPALAREGDPVANAANPAEAGAALLLQGSVNAAIASYTSALADTSISNDRRATLLNDRGVAYQRAGQPKLAIDDFNRAAQLLPEYAAIYNNRASVLISLGLYGEAIKDLDRAILLAPGFAAAYNNRASAAVRLNRLGDAIVDYSSAIRLMPQNPAPLSGRGRAHLALERPHAAVRDFSRAVAADERFAQGYRNRAEAKLLIEEYDSAIEDLSRAIAFDINNAEIYAIRGDAYLARRILPAAIADFSQAITLDPKRAEAYEGRGLTHALLKSFDEAFADLNRAIELDPRSAAAFAYRGYVYKEVGQPTVGQRDIDTAMKLAKDRADVLWAKGELEEAQGQVEQAAADYRAALERRPGYMNALEGLQRLGLPLDDGTGTVVAELGIEPFRVVKRGARYTAVSDIYPRLSVPLEMLGEGEPKLIAWEERTEPAIGVGLLRFNGGSLKTRSGVEATELVALIDVVEQRVMAITPSRQGSKSATWTWEQDKVTVSGIDGVSEDFDLRQVGAALAALPAAGRLRRSPNGALIGNQGAWAPWDQGLAGPVAQGDQRTAQAGKPKKKKPKTLFDLLFN